MAETPQTGFIADQKKAFEELKKAIREDKALLNLKGRAPISEEEKIDQSFPTGVHLNGWAKTHMSNIITWGVAGLMILALFSQGSGRKSSHHGINRYGERY